MLAGERLQAGEPDVFNFLAKTPTRQVEELVTRMWDFQSATERATNPKLSRMEKLQATAEAGCAESDACKWYKYHIMGLLEKHSCKF